MFVIHYTARAPQIALQWCLTWITGNCWTLENSYRFIRAHLWLIFSSCFPQISSTPFAQIYFPLISVPYSHVLEFPFFDFSVLIYFFKYLTLYLYQSFLSFSCVVCHLPFPHLTAHLLFSIPPPRPLLPSLSIYFFFSLHKSRSLPSYVYQPHFFTLFRSHIY